MTYGKAAQAESRLEAINRPAPGQSRRQRRPLTQGEYRQLNREENHLSDRIYDDKHGETLNSKGPGEQARRGRRRTQGPKSGAWRPVLYVFTRKFFGVERASSEPVPTFARGRF